MVPLKTATVSATAPVIVTVAFTVTVMVTVMVTVNVTVTVTVTVPRYCGGAGQGLALAIEDAVVLAWHLRRQGITQSALRRCPYPAYPQPVHAHTIP